jgi:molybdate transport system ATP-binding protein
MREAAAPFISLDGVCIRLYDGRAFNGVNWQILSDQNWAVVGPNGSGKSTLMKALCGRVPVVGGQITYHFSSNGTPPHDQVAYVAFDSQAWAVGHGGLYHQARWNSGVDHGSLSVADYFSEWSVKGRNPYQVVDERPDPSTFLAHRKQVVELLGIEALLDRSLWQVSNGERRKVMLARALLRRPRLLILDNPFTGLDAVFRARLTEIIGGLMQGDMRFVVVANGSEEIPPGISHVLVVDNGTIVAQGLRGEVLDAFSLALAGPQSGDGAWTVVHTERDGNSDEALVQMEGVNVAYGGVQILNGIEWTVRQGERWALLGPNGAGKTTLLSLILGDNPQAYANKITLFGRRRGSGESIWEVKRKIGWVAPELHLYYPRGLACFDVVCSGFFDSVGLYERPSPEQREAARCWMEHLGISPLAAAPFVSISEGQQRLVLMARAVVKNPALLVLDEPCQGLDAEHRDRVLQTVDAIGARLDRSLIYVTHDPHALPASISHLLQLEGGRIVSRGRIAGDCFGPGGPRNDRS